MRQGARGVLDYMVKKGQAAVVRVAVGGACGCAPRVKCVRGLLRTQGRRRSLTRKKRRLRSLNKYEASRVDTRATGRDDGIGRYVPPTVAMARDGDATSR